MLFSIIDIGKENVGLRFYTQHKEVCNMSKRIISILGVLILLCGLVPAGFAEETAAFSWWIPRNEDTSYYDNYRQNPVIQYTLATYTYRMAFGGVPDYSLSTASGLFQSVIATALLVISNKLNKKATGYALY